MESARKHDKHKMEDFSFGVQNDSRESDLILLLDKMRSDWDERALKNARHYVATSQVFWTDQEFFASGEEDVRGEILTDMQNICQGRKPEEMRVLEVGCGAGRVTRALARLFGVVHAVDVSGEMIRLARKALSGFPNVFLYQNNGIDLSVVESEPFDFAFSCLVFQHIPSRSVIHSYVHEVHRLLRVGALFKFQIQGDTNIRDMKHDDTWVGVPFSEEQIVVLAEECGFEPRYRYGVGKQLFWNWFFKLPQ